MSFISASYSVKKLSDKRYTSENTFLTTEAYVSPFDINANEVYTDFRYIPTSSAGLPYSGSSQNLGIISASVTDPTITAGDDVAVLKYWYRKKLKRGNQGGRSTWFFVEDDGFGSNDTVFSDQLITSSQQTNFISPKYIIADNSNNTTEGVNPGYKIQVSVGTDAASAAVVNNLTYVFDYKTGILSFLPGQTPAAVTTTTNYVFVSAYQYVGRTLNSQLADGSLGGGGDSEASASAGIFFSGSGGGFSIPLTNTASFIASGDGLSVDVSSNNITYTVVPNTLIEAVSTTTTINITASHAETASVASQVILTDDENGSSFRPIVFANPATGSSTLYTDETTLSYQPSKGQLNIGYNVNFLALQSSSIQSLIGGNTFNFLTATSSDGSSLTTINIGNVNTTVNISNSASISGSLTVGGQIYGTSSYALSASNVYVTDNDTTIANYPIVFHGGTAGNYVDLQSDDSKFTWNPGASGGTLVLGNNSNAVSINTGSFNVAGSSTFDFINSGPTTINAFGTATTLNIGSSTLGTATIKNTSIILGTQNLDKTIVSGTLDVKGGAIGTDDASFDLLNTTATTINFGGAATNITMGAANGTVNIAGSASIAGDLIVQGAVTSINTANLNIEDKFILLNSGSSTGDGGIIVSTNTNGTGTALFYDDETNRWGLTQQNSTGWQAAGATPKQYVVSVSSSAVAPTGNPSDFGTAAASWYGMMYVDTSDTADGGLYIYLP